MVQCALCLPTSVGRAELDSRCTEEGRGILKEQLSSGCDYFRTWSHNQKGLAEGKRHSEAESHDPGLSVWAALGSYG